ncbi:neutral/alkaline non-lysosomal ceramidase N-terminal domain-containing protein [Mariniluteicoccus flavus]
MSPRVLVGASVLTVEVPTGTPMSGFAARLSPSTGVHDATSVRALVIDECALVAVDVCALHEETCAQIESQSRLTTVVVTATHTHAGPCVGRGRVGTHSPDVHDAVVAAALEALDRAYASRRPARARWASARGAGVARDRRHLDRAIDPPVQALVFTTDEGAQIAAVVSYPCHPVVLDATNTRISADYVHFLRAELEERWAAPVVFLTGAAGDVNTGHTAEASFAGERGAERTFEAALRCGQALATAVAANPFQAVDLSTGVSVTSEPVALAYAELTQEQVFRDAAEWRHQRTNAPEATRMLLDLWLEWARAWSPVDAHARWRGRVTRMRVGAYELLFLPGEPFLGVAEALRGSRDDVLVAGYADGVPGYFPMAEDYADGGYEVRDAHRYYGMPAPFASGSAEALVAAARRLLDR